ncbi:hypothetical protein [Fimbriimonas ginsengisoli]|uniref:Uncharacterized protein n=1 Tax=Fimbriimonas ginsengisoli Gsoil 348 TaxID=661478 RepID=A0A068NX35_FIMGI|nr:hypothetical protein [Fimbriimonas ginsengisoli]AIE87350.1 hypothetical protein OP10G_3982 [Fimbriimonas ginsengisoli Gsoil 348]
MSLAVLLALHALRQADRISLTVPAAGLPAVLREISQQSGVKLEAAPVLSNEVLCLRVKDVPVDDLLSRVALVSGGEWQVSGGIRKLVPSMKIEKQERDERTASRRRQFQAALVTFHEEFRKHPVYDDREARRALEGDAAFQKQMEQWEKGMESGKTGDFPGRPDTIDAPATRALYRILESIPPNDWIDLPTPARIVYSDHPTLMQRSLPLSSQAAIQRYVIEQRIWDRLVLPLVNEQIAKEGEAAVMGSPLPEQFKVNLAIDTTESESAALTMKLSVLDSKGKEVQNAEFALNEPDVLGKDDAKVAAAPASKKPDPNEAPLPSDETAEGFLRLISRARQDMNAPNRADLLRSFLPQITHPEQYEPLAISPGKAYVALADRLGVNLISNISDFSLDVYTATRKKPTKPSQFLDQFDEAKMAVREPGWILIRSVPIGLERTYRINRRAAGKLVRSVSESSGLTIENAADYVAGSNSEYPLIAWDSAFVSALLPGGGRVSSLTTKTDELRLYGLLPTEMRQALREHPIAFSSLPEAAKGWLGTLVYWRGWLQDMEGNGPEPTELLPNGLPPDGLLRLVSETVETIVVPLGPGPTGLVPNGPPVTAAGFGRILGGDAGSATQKSRASQLRATTAFQTGKSRTLKFRIDFAPGVAHDFELSESLFPPSKSESYQNLPLAFRDAVDRARIEAVKTIRDQSTTPQTVPPPQ